MISNRETGYLTRVQVNDRSQIHSCTVLTGQIGNITDVNLVRSISMKPALYQVRETGFAVLCLVVTHRRRLVKPRRFMFFMIRATFLCLPLANSLASLRGAVMRLAPYKPFSSSKTAAIRAPSRPSAHVLATRSA